MERRVSGWDLRKRKTQVPFRPSCVCYLLLDFVHSRSLARSSRALLVFLLAVPLDDAGTGLALGLELYRLDLSVTSPFPTSKFSVLQSGAYISHNYTHIPKR
jgi:hypothetical protein